MTEKAAAYGDLAKKGLQFAVFVFLFLCTAFLYFIFAFVFLFRYMVIWILVILSPIAFACYILPVTKKYWSLWWNQFVQWNIIGITCGFFLNLAVICAKKIDVGIPPEKALGASLLPNLVPVVFLGLAFVFGLQTGAMGASSIIGIASRAQKRSGKWVGAKVWKKGVRPWAEPLAKRAAGGASKIAERVGGAGFTIRGRKIRPLGAMRWFWPEKLQKFAEARPTAEEEEKKAGAYASHTSGRMIANKSVTGFEGLGHLLSIIHRGDSQDLFKGFKDELGVETDEELLKDERFKKGVLPLLHLAQDAGMLTDIRRRDPRLAALLPGQKWAGEQYRKAESPEQAIAMATEEQRRQHLKDTEREAFENETVVETAMEKGSGYWSSVDTQVKRGVETSTRTMNKIFSKWVREKRGNLAEKLNSAIAAGDKELETATRNEINGLFMTEFRDDFRETHGGKDGFFEALRLPSFRKRGWRAPQYKTEAEMEAPPPAATPGGAVLRRAQVARRAHEIWEREGRPEGREKEHWAQAEREMSPPPLPTGRRGPSGRRPGGRRPSGRRPGGGGGAPSGRRA